MSVDVFGRQLRQTEGNRGPLGIGYKTTANGHYDFEKQRLCNVAAPNQSNNVVNLKTLQHIVRMEVKSIYDVISRLRGELGNLDLIVDGHRDDIDAKFVTLDDQIQMTTDMALKDSQDIKSIINKMATHSPYIDLLRCYNINTAT